MGYLFAFLVFRNCTAGFECCVDKRVHFDDDHHHMQHEQDVSEHWAQMEDSEPFENSNYPLLTSEIQAFAYEAPRESFAEYQAVAAGMPHEMINEVDFSHEWHPHKFNSDNDWNPQESYLEQHIESGWFPHDSHVNIHDNGKLHQHETHSERNDEWYPHEQYYNEHAGLSQAQQYKSSSSGSQHQNMQYPSGMQELLNGSSTNEGLQHQYDNSRLYQQEAYPTPYTQQTNSSSTQSNSHSQNNSFPGNQSGMQSMNQLGTSGQMPLQSYSQTRPMLDMQQQQGIQNIPVQPQNMFATNPAQNHAVIPQMQQPSSTTKPMPSQSSQNPTPNSASKPQSETNSTQSQQSKNSNKGSNSNGKSKNSKKNGCAGMSIGCLGFFLLIL